VARIALLTGGSTPERDVAHAGTSRVALAALGLGHEVVVVDTIEGALGARREAELLDPTVNREPPSAAALAELAARENLPALVAGPALRGSDLLFLVLHGGAASIGCVAVGDAAMEELYLLLEDSGTPGDRARIDVFPLRFDAEGDRILAWYGRNRPEWRAHWASVRKVFHAFETSRRPPAVGWDAAGAYRVRSPD